MNVFKSFGKNIFWSTERPSPDKPDDGYPLARYKFAANYVKGLKVLDIGCGQGEGAKCFIDNGATSVLGIDYSPITIAHCQKTIEDERLSFAVMDATNLQIDEKSFDVIVALEIIEHLQNPEILLSKICSSLRSGGIAIISTPNKLISSPNSIKPINPYHVREYLPHEFQGLLLSFFVSVECFGFKLTNPDAISNLESIRASWRWKVARKLVNYHIIRSLLEPIPPRIKQLWTRENRMHIDADNYDVSADYITNSQVVISTCRKPIEKNTES